MGSQSPLKKISKSGGGGGDRCSTPPPIQNLGGVETPPPCLAPLNTSSTTISYTRFL